MARLDILRYPDPRLHTVAKPVGEVDERIRRLVDDMLATMYEAEGVGLAATQVDVHERVIVIDVSDGPAGLNSPSVIASGQLIAEFGLAMNTPAEWGIVRVRKDTRAIDQQMAAQQ